MESDDFFDWDDIILDIRNRRAVLVVGTDFLPFAGDSVHHDLHQHLIQRDNHGIDYFYPKNGVFLFRSSRYKVQAQKRAALFYKHYRIDDFFSQKITEVPFPLIVSLNPDHLVTEVFRKNHFSPQVDFFTWRPQKNKPNLVSPGEYNPIVYNLFGSIDSYESLILDYEDLFDHLKKLLNDVNVPNLIRTILNEAETYIFLDFKLDSWYSQLVFRYLNMKDHHFDDKNKNYATKPTIIDPNTDLFFKQQFNVKYYGTTKGFFEQLHQKYFAALVEMDVSTQSLTPREKVERYLSENKVKNALNVIAAHQDELGEEERDIVVLLKSDYTQFEQQSRLQVVSASELQLMLNRLKVRILGVSKYLD
jgi:hypothetical protein